MQDKIQATKEFLKQQFTNFPHYSFGDGDIMYQHGLRVLAWTQKILSEVPADSLVVSIGALLHDIGKTYPADDITLHQQHDQLGYQVAQDLLDTLDLDAEQYQKIATILQGDFSSTEGQIIKDADIIAFFDDRHLQTVFAQWADDQDMTGELERKFAKIDKLNFAVSR